MYLLWIFVLFCFAWKQECIQKKETAYYIQFIMSGNLDILSILDSISFLSKKHKSESISNVIKERGYTSVYNNDFWDKLESANDIFQSKKPHDFINHLIKEGRKIASSIVPMIEGLESMGERAIYFVNNCLLNGPLNERST